MAKTLLISGEDDRLMTVITDALQANGYVIDEINELSDTADIAVICSRDTDPECIRIGSITIDFDNVCVYDSNRDIIHFTPIEFSMLSYLAKNSHRSVSRNELLPAVWGFENTDSSRVADDTVKRLRRKLKNTDLVLETVWKYGFRIRVK